MLKNIVNSNLVKGMDVTNINLKGICEDCILGKMDEKSFENHVERDTHLFRMLHADLIGPMSPKARWTHAKFCLVINDNCSGFGFIFKLKHKDETSKVIIDLDRAIENKFQRQVHMLKTDNSGEFLNNELHKHTQLRGISTVTSVPYNHELNRHAKRWNRTIIEGVRTMLKDSDLGKDLWGEAISTHIYICNRCPSSILPNNITPFEKVFGHAPSIGHL